MTVSSTPLARSAVDPVSLRLLLAIVDTGSVAAGARREDLSQPAASLRISRLESSLGLKLLERSPTGSVLTLAGIEIAAAARSLLGAIDEFGAVAGRLQDLPEPPLHIVASYTIAEYLLPRWLQRFRAAQPRAEFDLAVANSTVVIDQVRSGQADLGFVESPGSVNGLIERDVDTDRLLVVVPPGHDWATRDDVSIEEVAATPLALREQGSGTRAAFDMGMAEAGFRPVRPALELGSTTAVRSTAISSGVPTVLSELAVAAELAAGTLVAVPVKGWRVGRRLRAVWAGDRRRHLLVDDLVESIVGAASPDERQP